MNNIIENLLLISIQASVLILAVLVLRLFLNKTHKRFTYFMWMLVLFRLCIPVQIESPVGLFSFNSGEQVVESVSNDDNSNQVTDNNHSANVDNNHSANVDNMSDSVSGDVSGDLSNSKLDSEVDNVLDNEIDNVLDNEIGNNSNTVVGDTSDKVSGEDNNTVPGTVLGGATDVLGSVTKDNDNVSIEDKITASIEKVSSYSFDIEAIVMFVWIVGMIAVVSLAIIQLIMLKKRIRFAINTSDNIWETDKLDTAFVMGVFRAKIYVPTNITENEREHIISHERMHIKHGDHIVRVVMLLVNIIYWWNPLVWVATHFMKKDMEMLCDESVIKDMADYQRREYLTTLLHCSAKNSGIIPVMSFGETNTENRIRHIINLREPKLYILLVLAIFVVACVTCCTESAKEGSSESVMDNQDNEDSNTDDSINDDKSDKEPLGNQNNTNTNVNLNSTMSNKNENLPFECGTYMATDVDNLRHMEINQYFLIMWDTTKFWEGQTVGLEGLYYYKYFYYDVNDGVINVYTDINKDIIAFQMNVKDEHTIEFDGAEYMLKEYIYDDDSSASDDSSSILDEDEVILKGIYIPENGDGTQYIQIGEYDFNIIDAKLFQSGQVSEYVDEKHKYEYLEHYGYRVDKEDMIIRCYNNYFNEVGRSQIINKYTIVYNGTKYIHKDYTDKNVTININKTGYKQYDEFIEKMVNIHNGDKAVRWDKFEELGMSYLWGYEDTFDNGGFYLIDLDGDGIEEMLLGENGPGAWAGVIYGIYSIRDGKLVRLCTGWDRNRYYLCEGNIIWNEGSSGAAHNTDAYYTYENGEWKLNMSVCCLSYYNDPEGIKYLAVYEDDEYCEKDGVRITEEEYNDFLSIGKDKYIPIEFTLFESVTYN